MIEITDHSNFFKLQQQMQYVPFTQSEAWCNMIVGKETKVRFFVNSTEEPLIAAWGVESKIPFFNKTIIRINGEAYNKINDEKIIKEFYQDIQSSFEAVEIDSNNKYNIDFEIGIRRAGFKRPIGTFSCPLTLENNLKDEQQNRSRSWKRNVKVAEKSGLIFQEITQPSVSQIKEFVTLFSEMAKTKNMTHVVGFSEIEVLLSDSSVKLYVVSTPDNETLAFRIVQVHKAYAYDIFASNSDKSREYRGATYFMVEYIFKSLKQEGIDYFDFGRIPPSNHSTDKVYEFKIGARGNKIQYNGEWVSYKSFKVELLVFLYKYFKLKKQRY
jgi:lipid II:glycine glycyltransferase (peptidoglycan interpeptide bridge formation enzyme)